MREIREFEVSCLRLQPNEGMAQHTTIGPNERGREQTVSCSKPERFLQQLRYVSVVACKFHNDVIRCPILLLARDTIKFSLGQTSGITMWKWGEQLLPTPFLDIDGHHSSFNIEMNEVS